MNEQQDDGPVQEVALQGSGALDPIKAIDAVAPAGWRMKLARAMAQLFAGTEKGAVVYGQMRERIDTIEGQTEVSRTLARAVAQQAMQDPEVMERAKARFLGTALRQQENLEAVIIGAGQHLPLLPAPSALGSPPTGLEQEDADQTKSMAGPNSEPFTPDEPLHPDWAATFTGIAENATTEELRDRLSRILAGELASPGTYSRATVRAISELEQSDLKAVQPVLPYVLANHLIQTAGGNALPTVDMLLPLVDAGLVIDANAMLTRNWPAAPAAGGVMMLAGLNWGLHISMNGGRVLSLPVVPLTRTGLAVVDLLGRPDERSILRRIADELSPESFSRIVLGKTLNETNLKAPLEQLFPKPITSTFTNIKGASPFNPVGL